MNGDKYTNNNTKQTSLKSESKDIKHIVTDVSGQESDNNNNCEESIKNANIDCQDAIEKVARDSAIQVLNHLKSASSSNIQQQYAINEEFEDNDEEIKQDELEINVAKKQNGVEDSSQDKQRSSDKLESDGAVTTTTQNREIMGTDTQRQLLEEKQNQNDKPRCDGTYAELPGWQQDNEYIETGYRLNQKTCTQVTVSMCQCHNETANVWSHFIGMLGFFTTLLIIAIFYKNMEGIGEQGLKMYSDASHDFKQGDLSLKDYIGQKLSIMEVDLESSQSKYGQLNDEEGDKAAARFSKKFSLQIERQSYLLVENIQNNFQNFQTVSQKKKDDSKKMLRNLIEIVTNFHKFVKKMQAYNTVIVGSLYLQIYNEQLARLQVIKSGLEELQTAYPIIEQKIEAWVDDDTSFDIEDIINPLQILTYVPRWPLIIHLIAACFCLGSSAFFHLYFIQSEKISNILSRLDYGGISVMIMGSSYPPIYYAYACEPVIKERIGLMALISISCFICFTITLMPRFDQPKYRTFRGSMFVILGLSAGVPFSYFYIQKATDTGKFLLPGFDIGPWIYGGLCYIIGAVLFVSRTPERWFPRKLDLVGSSHQIHHMCVIIGCTIHFVEGFKLYTMRKSMVCPVALPSITIK